MVTGAAGLLGTDLVETLQSHDEQVTALERGDLDLLDEAAVVNVLANHDVLVNCAAWTAVDDAERNEAAALQVNGTIPAVLAAAAQRCGAWMVQISTDYVFDGDSRDPYPEGARPAPRSAYGRGKALGEQLVRKNLPDRHLVLRTAWLYGEHGECFPKTILRLASQLSEVTIVADQFGQPTWTIDLADLIWRLVKMGAPAGTYHCTSSGQCSWFDFARAVVSSASLDPNIVHPTVSAEYPRPAPRPTSSVLAHDALPKIGIEPIGPWHERWTSAAPHILGLDPGPSRRASR